MGRIADRPGRVVVTGTGESRRILEALSRKDGEIETEPSKPLPRVLLIGDSICGGYQQGVKRLLAGKADVVKQQGNGQHTWTGWGKTASP